MATRAARARIELAGGWATDFGPVFSGAPQGHALVLPWLQTAENVVFDRSGWPRTVGGTTRVNAAAVTEGASVAQTFEGIFDYWKQGTAGSETQDRVAVVGTKYMKEDVDGTWDQIVASKETGKQPAFTVFKDDLIISTTSTTDVPYVWDQSSGANLGGSPPNFAFSVEHKNRVFAAGVAANMSRLYYCEHLDHEDWTGAGAGSIDVAPDDGDRIVGLVSHKNQLWIFKGPHRLSIYTLTGSAPTGDDPFTLKPFITKGVGGVNHNAIVPVGGPAGEDVVFLSPLGVHSLQATAAFGDMKEGFLSAPIQTHYTDSLNPTALPTAWGVNYTRRQAVVWTVAPRGTTVKRAYLVLHYGFQPMRWARWASYQAANCLAILETSRQHRLFAGTTTGFVEHLDVHDRTLASESGYRARVDTPYLTFGSAVDLKGLAQGVVGFIPKSSNLIVGTTCDAAAETTQTIDQTGGGVPLGEFLLGTDTLGSSALTWGALDFSVGEFRAVAFSLRTVTDSADMEPRALEVLYQPAGVSMET